MYNSQYHPIYRLPPEILLLIFSEFHWDDSEPSTLPVTGHVPWFEHVRMLKAIQLVCRAWHKYAAPILYSVVYLRHIEQLPALVRILDERQSAKRGISHWIECIYCELYVPLTWERVYSENITQLLSLCRTVRKLVYQPVLGNDPSGLYDRAVNLLRILRFDDPFPNLRELRLGESFFGIIDLGRHIFSCFPQLRMIRMAVDSCQGPHFDVILPNVETFICDFTTMEPNGSVLAIANRWKLPKLRDLSIVYACAHQPGTEIPLGPIEIICTGHGARLLSLKLDNRGVHRAFANNLSSIFAACPNLTHLTYSYHLVPSLRSSTDESSPTHPMLTLGTLRCVSFFPYCMMDEGTADACLRRHLTQFSDRSAFPSLDTIVILDPLLRGKSVDVDSLSFSYVKTLCDYSARLANRGVRLLNCDSYPLDVASTAEDLDSLDTEDSDEDYEVDSGESSLDSSSDTDVFDFEAEIHG